MTALATPGRTWPAARLPGAACHQRWRQQPYRETLQLRDGRAVLLRPAHHSDADALQRFFAGLSPQARLLRFHGVVNRLPDEALRRLTTQVPQQHVALVAVARAHDGASTLLAEARYAVGGGGEDDGNNDPSDPNDLNDPSDAEFALAVAEGWRGQGLGRALLQRLAVHAQASGLRSLRGSVLPGNEPMLALMRALGAQWRGSGADLQVRLSLG